MESTENQPKVATPVEVVATVESIAPTVVPKKTKPVVMAVVLSSMLCFAVLMGGLLYFMSHLPETQYARGREKPIYTYPGEEFPDDDLPSYFFEDFEDRVLSVSNAFCETQNQMSHWLKGEVVIIVCPDSSVHFVRDLNEMNGERYAYEWYPLGSEYDSLVEKYFPDGKYFFCDAWCGVAGLPSYLKIFVQADSEEDLTAKYAETVFAFLREFGENEMQVMIYYSNTTGGVESAYEKILLHDILTVPYPKRTIFGSVAYEISPADPEVVQRFFRTGSDEHPESIVRATRENRHVEIYVQNFMSMPKEVFMNRFPDFFQK